MTERYKARLIKEGKQAYKLLKEAGFSKDQIIDAGDYILEKSTVEELFHGFREGNTNSGKESEVKRRKKKGKKKARAKGV